MKRSAPDAAVALNKQDPRRRTQRAYAERKPHEWKDRKTRALMVGDLADQGKSLREIATILGISFSTARRDLQRRLAIELDVTFLPDR